MAVVQGQNKFRTENKGKLGSIGAAHIIQGELGDVRDWKSQCMLVSQTLW